MKINVLLVADASDGHLSAAVTKTVSAAQVLQPDTVDLAILSASPAALVGQAEKIAGISRVLTVSNSINECAVAHGIGPQLAVLAKGYSHVVFDSSTFLSKELMSVVAALLGVNYVYDLMGNGIEYVLDRPIVAASAGDTEQMSSNKLVVAQVRPDSFIKGNRDNLAEVNLSAGINGAIQNLNCIEKVCVSVPSIKDQRAITFNAVDIESASHLCDRSLILKGLSP